MTERVWDPGPVLIDPDQGDRGAFEGGHLFQSLRPWLPHEDRPCWIKHLRIYEKSIELADPDAYAVLADAMQIGNRDSVDDVIRHAGIVGSWRPSTIIVRRFTDYAANRLIVDSPTVAHALWNTDLHVASQRGYDYSLEIWNDHDRPRWIRAVFHTVAMTDAELGLGPPDHVVQENLNNYATQTDARILRVERELAVFQKQHRELVLKLNALKAGEPWDKAGG